MRMMGMTMEAASGVVARIQCDSVVKLSFIYGRALGEVVKSL